MGRALAQLLPVLLLLLLLLACRGPAAPRSPFAVADSLRLLGSHAASLVHYARLRDSLARTSDTAGLWHAELWLGAGQAWVGHRDSAEQVLARARRLAAGDPRREGWTHSVTSIFLDLQGRYDSALTEATRARQLADEIGDPELDAAVLDATARIYAFTGRYQEMLRLDSTSVARRRARGGEPRALLARELSSLGIALYQVGRASESIAALEESLSLYEELGGDDGIARALSSLALTYQTNGHVERAGELLHRAIAIGERTNPPQYARTAVAYNNLGWVYIAAENFQAARPYLERALEISRSTGQPYAGALARLNLATVALETGDTAGAEGQLESALALIDSVGYQSLRADPMGRLGLIAAWKGDRTTAMRLTDSAIATARSAGFLASEYDALQARARSLEWLKDTAGAIAAHGETVALLESWRGRVALGDLQMGIGEPRLEPYEGLVRLAVARGRYEEAFGFAERARARALLELMARREANPRPASDEERWYERLRTQLSSPADPSAAEGEVGALADTIAALEAELKRRDPAIGAARYPRPVPLSQVRRTLTGPRRGVLAFFWGDRDVYGWWIASDTVRAARLGPADSLGALVTFLHRLIQSPRSTADWLPASRRVYRALVAPLTTADVDELLVVPDGPLAQIPLEVLAAGPGPAPLGGTRRIIYGPSASVLVALQRAKPREAWARAMLAVGDPAVRTIAKADPFRDATAEAPGPLPHAGDEARAIRDLFSQRGSDLLVRRAATLERWLASDPGRYRYLHFAAHARVDTRRPERTHVLLSGAELDLRAIRRLRLNAELVTLSACESGLGRRFRGEGVIGLPHAFLAAGARGAVVTLWRVEDRYAAEFMQEFYRRVAAGVAPADALQAVRRTWMAETGPRSHPARWAPFVLVGGLASAGG